MASRMSPGDGKEEVRRVREAVGGEPLDFSALAGVHPFAEAVALGLHLAQLATSVGGLPLDGGQVVADRVVGRLVGHAGVLPPGGTAPGASDDLPHGGRTEGLAVCLAQRVGGTFFALFTTSGGIEGGAEPGRSPTCTSLSSLAVKSRCQVSLSSLAVKSRDG